MTRPLLLVEALATRNDSGLGKLVRMFVHGLKGLADYADIKVIVPTDSDFNVGPHCLPIQVQPRPMRLWTQTAFPWLIRKLQPKAVLCLGWTLPLYRPPAQYGLLIADVGPLEATAFPMSSRDKANRNWLRRMPQKANLILTNAAFTKKRINNILGILPNRIEVVRPIHLDWFSNYNSADAGLLESSLFPNGSYFLAVGNIEPRKNFPGLIAAYATLKKKHPDTPPLYIVGHKAWGFPDAWAAVTQFGIADSIYFTGYLSDADRNAYVAHCTLFISSSLYEGWGLPLFEALALGRPAIYHGDSSQAEFASGFALAVDCSNPNQLAEAMEKLWTIPSERQKYLSALQTGFPRILEYDLESALRAAVLPLLAHS